MYIWQRLICTFGKDHQSLPMCKSIFAKRAYLIYICTLAMTDDLCLMCIPPLYTWRRVKDGKKVNLRMHIGKDQWSLPNVHPSLIYLALGQRWKKVNLRMHIGLCQCAYVDRICTFGKDQFMQNRSLPNVHILSTYAHWQILMVFANVHILSQYAHWQRLMVHAKCAFLPYIPGIGSKIKAQTLTH